MPLSKLKLGVRTVLLIAIIASDKLMPLSKQDCVWLWARAKSYLWGATVDGKHLSPMSGARGQGGKPERGEESCWWLHSWTFWAAGRWAWVRASCQGQPLITLVMSDPSPSLQWSPPCCSWEIIGESRSGCTLRVDRAPSKQPQAD